MLKHPKIYITGSTGYLGKALTNSLSKKQLGFSTLKSKSSLPWRLGDAPSFDSSGGVLVHIAWDMHVENGNVEGADINVAGSILLVQAAVEANIKVIFISSLSAFEGTRSHYGQSKLKVENFVKGNGGIVIRPGLLWSTEIGYSAILLKFESLVLKLPILPYFKFKQGAQYCTNVENLCQLIIEMTENPEKWDNQRPVYAHPKPFGLNDLLKSIATINNKSVLLIKIPVSIIQCALWCLEKLNLKLFKLDSLIGVLYSDPKPSFSVFAKDTREFLR